MAISQHRSKKKPSGSRYVSSRGKRKRELASLPVMTKIGETKQVKSRKMGGSTKIKLLVSETANIIDPKTKKFTKAKIIGVDENPANRHFIIRNIITKGAIIKTDKGKARITNRPSQEGSINAVLV